MSQDKNGTYSANIQTLTTSSIDPMAETIGGSVTSTPTTLVPGQGGSYTGSPFWDSIERDSLIGKVCTFIDASIDDLTKRKAMKDQLKEIIRGSVDR